MTVTAIANPTTAEGGEQTKAKGGLKKKLIMVLVVLLAVGGAAYWFVLRPKPAHPAPKPGDVVKLDPIQLNLAASHYLRMGLALQLVQGVKEADGSKALDAAIEEFSGQQMADVNDPTKREAYKKKLEKVLDERYDGEVMGVYFTEFVTQ